MSTANSSAVPVLEDPSETEVVLEIILMAVIGVLGTSISIIGAVVVRRSTIAKGIVAHYAYFDLFGSGMVNLCHVIWGVPCAIWTLNEAFPVLDYIMSGLAFSVLTIAFPAKILIGINRYFAISFDGVYYSRLERTFTGQYVFMFVYPVAHLIAYAVPGCNAVFIPYGENFFYVQGECGLELIFWTQTVPSYVILISVTFLDVSVFYLLHQHIRALRRAQTHSDDRKKLAHLKKQLKLAAQMLSNLVTACILTATVSVAESLIRTKLQEFLIFTLFWQACNLVICLNYVVFLYERRPKEEAILVSQISGNASHQRSPR